MSHDPSHEPPVRVMALHALRYCERLFYLEEVEEIRVADDRVFAGRALHEGISDLEEGEFESLNLAGDNLGLVGKVDVLRRRDGQWIPYEHKRGRAWKARDGLKGAWPPDALQVSAYGMLIEEQFGCEVLECRVRYHADGVTVRVPLDEPARLSVKEAVQRARELRASPDRPPVTESESRCIRCSLAPVCLPEEERLVTDPQWDTVRLFPPHTDRKSVHITANAATVRRSGDTIIVDARDQPRRRFPVHDVQSLVIHGHAQVTTQALRLCAANDVAVHWLTGGGAYVGCLSAGPGPVQRRIRQYRSLSKPKIRLDLAKLLAHARAESQLRYVLRATRKLKPRPVELTEALDTIRSTLRSIHKVKKIDSLRGHEGAAARAYFSALPFLLSDDLPRTMIPDGRSRRPPRDRFNALLSFGYSLLYRSVLESVLSVGLEPAFGFYHTPRSAAHPLVLDLMELFRLPVWDIALIGSLNRKQWDPDADFQVTKAKVWLSDSGRKKAISIYERRLEEKWKHPVTDYSLSYARTIELEVRLLEKEWTGKPGLFARARLR